MVRLSTSAIKGHHHQEQVEEDEDPTRFDHDFHDLTSCFLDHLTDFDPVKEWLVDPDQNPMPDSDLVKECEKMEKVNLFDSSNGGDGTTMEVVEESKDEVKNEGVGEVCTVSDPIKVADDESNEEESSKETESEESGESSSESDSSDSSSSEEESSSSSEDEEEETKVVEIEEGEINGDELEEIIAGSDGEEDVVRGAFKLKHEMEVLPPVPPVEVSLEPHHQTLPVGFVSSILDNRVIVEGSEKHSPLNEGSILWITETRSLLGRVDEIFGPVKNPYYIIRYNSDEEIPPDISVGASISFVMEFADHILIQNDLYERGYDGEDATEEAEFSDDEKEAEFRRSLRQKKRDTDNGNQESGFGKKKTSIPGSGFHADKQSQPPRSLPAVGHGNFGCSNCNCTSGASNQGMSTAPPMVPAFPQPPQPQQYNPTVSPQGFPLQPQSIGIQGGFPFPVQPMGIQGSGLPINWLPNQHQNPVLNNFAGGIMPYWQQQQQQQFFPNFGPLNGNMPWFGGSGNPPFGVGLAGFGCGNVNPQGPLAPSGVGTMGFGPGNMNPQGPLAPNDVGIMGFGSGNVNLQGPFGPSNVQQRNGQVQQGEPRPPSMQFNQGRSPSSGRRPFQRGRHSFGGRGGNQCNG